jgi:ABC-type branched-subunit amino acid transport system substrate-binding protein
VDGGATEAWSADPIIIGAAIARSGPIAPYDEGPARAMEIAIEEINVKGGLLGRPLKIIYADTKFDIAYGATAAQQVIDQKAAMVVPPESSCSGMKDPMTRACVRLGAGEIPTYLTN